MSGLVYAVGLTNVFLDRLSVRFSSIYFSSLRNNILEIIGNRPPNYCRGRVLVLIARVIAFEAGSLSKYPEDNTRRGESVNLQGPRGKHHHGRGNTMAFHLGGGKEHAEQSGG